MEGAGRAGTLSTSSPPGAGLPGDGHLECHADASDLCGLLNQRPREFQVCGREVQGKWSGDRLPGPLHWVPPCLHPAMLLLNVGIVVMGGWGVGGESLEGMESLAHTKWEDEMEKDPTDGYKSRLLGSVVDSQVLTVIRNNSTSRYPTH